MKRLVPLTLIALLACGSTADAKPRLKIKGGQAQSITACGKQVKGTVAPVGKRVGVITPKRVRVRVAQCVLGKYTAVSGKRGRQLLDTKQDADLRVKARGRTKYVRVGSGPIVELPISFDVLNGDETTVGCPPADGSPFKVRGHVTARAAELDAKGDRATTLYAHGHSFSEELWRYKGVPGYDFVGEMADRGHISVTYDRLGYETSDYPDGTASCYGTEATVADQMITKLKSGEYTLEGHAPIDFSRVALAGHSQAALFSSLAVSTFKNADALLDLSFVESAITPGIATKYNQNLGECESSPSTANQQPGAPSGYAFRGVTEEDFVQTNFTMGADPAVVEHFKTARNVDPCGFPFTALETVATNNAQNSTIDVPVLVVLGDDDPNFAPGGAQIQGATFSGSDDVTIEMIDGGHALMLEDSHREYQNVIDAWLNRRDF